MGNNVRALEKERIGRLLIRYAFPIILTYLISELYALVDTYFIGKYVSDMAMGAVLIIYPIELIMIAAAIMFAIGTATRISHSLGDKDISSVEKSINSGLSISFLVFIPILIILSVFPQKVLTLLGAETDLLPYGLDYIKIVAPSFLFIMIDIYLCDVMLAFGNSRIAVVTTSIGAITNVVLDYLFVVHLRMGVRGAAIATGISEFMGAVISVVVFMKYRRAYSLKLRFSFDKAMYRNIFIIGAAAFVINSEDGIMMTVLNKLISGVSGESGIVVLGISTKIYMFLFITICGIASAMQPICSYNAGAKNYGRIKQVMKKTLMYALMSSGIIWIFCMIFARNLVMILIREPYLVDKAVKAFRTMIMFYPMISVYYCSIYYFQAIGSSKRSLSLAVTREMLLIIPLSIVFVKILGLGEMGIFISFPVSDFICMIFSMNILKKGSSELENEETLKLLKERFA